MGVGPASVLAVLTSGTALVEDVFCARRLRSSLSWSAWSSAALHARGRCSDSGFHTSSETVRRGRISMGNAFLSTNGLLTARVGWSLGDSVSASCSLNEMYFFRLFGILEIGRAHV